MDITLVLGIRIFHACEDRYIERKRERDERETERERQSERED